MTRLNDRNRLRWAGALRGGYLLTVLVLVAMVGCAKKLLPPSPDRWAPRLLAVETRTRSQVALIFDEGINGAKLRPDSFLLTGPAGETIALRGAALGSNPAEVDLWTPIQEVKLYEVRGVAWDHVGNKTRFRARFRGSSLRDTIPPRIARVEPGPGTIRQRRGVRVSIGFSEAVDTSGVIDYMFVPAAYDSGFKRAWSSDWQSFSFTRLETLPRTAKLYVLVRPRVTDLEGNRLEGTAFTYFTSDTVFDGVTVKGRAVWSGKIAAGAVFFTESAAVNVIADSLQPPRSETLPERTTGLAPVLADGSFATSVHKGEYQVMAAADTNDDGIADLVSPAVAFNTDAESLSLALGPESLPQPLNAYRR